MRRTKLKVHGLALAALAWGGCADLGWGDGGEPLPEGAEVVDDDRMAELRRTGQLVPITAEERAARRDQEAQRDADAEALVAAYVAERPELRARFEYEPPASVGRLPDGSYEVSVGDRSVVLQGRRPLTRDTAHTLRAMRDRDARARTLRLLYPHMPPECRALVPPQREWDALDLDAIVQATDAMTDCWVESVEPSETPVELPLSVLSPGGTTIVPVADASESMTSDSNRNCYDDPNDPSTYRAPTNTSFQWWAGRHYLSPVRDQDNRGTCVAFATASALEFHVARTFGRRTNLSEQAIYALGKAILYDEPDSDGLPTSDFLDDVAHLGWAMPFEPTWPYNPATGRIDGWSQMEGLASFRGVCSEYDFPVCTETSHETGTYCQQINGTTSCSLWTPGYVDGYSIPVVHEIGDFDDDDIHEVLAFLAAGFTAVLSLDVTDRFRDIGRTPGDPNPAFFNEGRDDDSPVIGGHALHLLAYQSANGLDAPHIGRGWILVKNSWGCGWGDNGVAWLPVPWIRDHFRSVVVLVSQREGSNHAPDVQITAPASGAMVSYGGFFPEPIVLEATADDREDGEGCCTFEWRSNLEGVIGTGSRLEHVFTVPGAHVVSAYATDSEGKTSWDWISVHLTNQVPSAAIVAPSPVSGGSHARVYRGVTTMFVGQGDDPNEPFSLPCASHEWASSEPSDEVPEAGCAVPIRFESTGTRTITLQVRDAVGLTASATLDVEVVEPPASLEPQVMIVSPATDGEGVPPNTLTALAATVDNAGGEVLTGQWGWRPAGSEGPLQPMTLTRGLGWRPSLDVPFECGGSDIEIVYEVTNGAQVWRAVRAVRITFEPC